MNVRAAENLLKQLSEQGVESIALCPGGRNAPFVAALEKAQGFKVYPFFDERSASFFALGRARRDSKPAAVVTTSGTAVSELGSAVIEAYYSATPLVLVTADRPKRLRGTGAPQAIRQTHLFGEYLEKVWDYAAGEAIEITLAARGPCQINVCFDEPLIDDEVSETQYRFEKLDESLTMVSEVPQISLPQPLIVVGALPFEAREKVSQALSELNVPIFCEALSGLRGEALNLLSGGSRVISQMLRSGQVQSLLRIGDVPIGRFWRDLDLLDIPTYCLSDKKFPGMEEALPIPVNWSTFDLSHFEFETWDFSQWKELGEQRQNHIIEAVDQFPNSEVSFFKQLVEHIPQHDSIYLGNSLPVRQWDMVAQSSHKLFANRGANGIDGQLATALGVASPNRTQWVILGDLTTLYDMSSFWSRPHLESEDISINLCVINNKGGQIFSRIFSQSLFRNEHEISFEPLAKMWGWNYYPMTDPNQEFPQSGFNLIEILPDREQSTQFWQRFDQI